MYNESLFDPIEKWLLMSMIALVTIGVVTALSLSLIETSKECTQKTDSWNCSAQDICEADCESLHLQYFNYDYTSGGLFGGGGESECWCRDGDETKQIW